MTGALLLLGGNGLVSWAEQRVPSGVAALLVTTTPLWVAIIDWARPGGVRPTRRGVVGLLVGFAGVGLLVGPGPVRREEPVHALGAAAVVLAAFSWATGSVYMARRKGARRRRRWGGDADDLRRDAAGRRPLRRRGGPRRRRGRVGRGRWRRWGTCWCSGRSWRSSAYVWLLKVEPPARVATYAYVNPVVAVLLGWAFGGEQVGPGRSRRWR